MASSDESRAKAIDPDTSLAELEELAGVYPIDVLENPALPLLSLEDPGFYARVMAKATKNRGNAVIAELGKNLTPRHSAALSAYVVRRWDRTMASVLPKESKHLPVRLARVLQMFAEERTNAASVGSWLPDIALIDKNAWQSSCFMANQPLAVYQATSPLLAEACRSALATKPTHVTHADRFSGNILQRGIAMARAYAPSGSESNAEAMETAWQVLVFEHLFSRKKT